ncbi:MAG TPA: topoisomerase C-terminal repeat-containing protein, partial [Rubricoccaceae bacterium]|nr:topoisomerase C-terminal repeat-containing protein [Rubricoccaceae bacterium]
VELLRLPRTVGAHPDTGTEIKANIGRFGPYVQHGSTFASLKPEDDVMTVTLDRALELIASKTRGSQALRQLGRHPETGDLIEVFEGRYGPYVKSGKVNATLPKGTTPERVTLEEAVQLLAEKAAKGGGKPKGRRRSAKAS